MVEIDEKSQIVKSIKQSQIKDEFKTFLIDLVNKLTVDNIDINELKKSLDCSLCCAENIEGNDVLYKKYTPSNKTELINMIHALMIVHGYNCDLNCIDTSKITDMSELFSSEELRLFNGDIFGWNVSNVKDMHSMFSNSKFNGDISKWDVSNVEDMRKMFYKSDFNGDISKWNVSNVKFVEDMFSYSKFDGDTSEWNVSNVVI